MVEFANRKRQPPMFRPPTTFDNIHLIASRLKVMVRLPRRRRHGPARSVRRGFMRHHHRPERFTDKSQSPWIRVNHPARNTQDRYWRYSGYGPEAISGAMHFPVFTRTGNNILALFRMLGRLFLPGAETGIVRIVHDRKISLSPVCLQQKSTMS